jgi:hypothetical protein
MKKLLILALSLASSAVMANTPVSVKIGEMWNDVYKVYVPAVYVYSEVNQIVINGISVNNGNCRVEQVGQLRNIKPAYNGTTQDLQNILGQIQNNRAGVTRYGDYQPFLIDAKCNVREIKVNTNQGSYSFSAR